MTKIVIIFFKVVRLPAQSMLGGLTINRLLVNFVSYPSTVYVPKIMNVGWQ